MPNIRIALAQVNPIMGNFDYNINLVKSTLQKTRNQQCDLVIFPELVLCGYPPEDLLLRPGFLEDAQEALDAVLPDTEGLTAIIGYPGFQHREVYNAAAVLNNGKCLAVYNKIELPNYGIFDEKRYFKRGNQPLLFEMNQVRFGLTICEDIWVNGGQCRDYLKDMQPDYIINLAASPYHAAKSEERKKILVEFSRKTGAAMLYVNLVGGQDELVFDGTGMIIDHNGHLTAQAGHFEETLLIKDIEIKSTPWPLRRGHEIVIASGCLEPKSVLTEQAASEFKTGIEEIHHALVLGTKDYVRKNNFKKAVIGLSGGIDSAVTAAIAVEALGAGNVLAVSMPSQYSSDETKKDAELCAQRLGVECNIISIQSVFTAYRDALAAAMSQDQPGLEMENLQARIRGNYLMALSNKYGWLVLTTGNKSETAVGYCTLYGDMAGGFAVIKDVYKTTVYELAEYINQQAGREIIPQSIIARPPSAELKENQKDEDSLPPYEVLDPILKAYIEDDLGPEDIINKGFDKQTVLDIIRLVDKNEYKRRQAPPGVKITPKAFGRDRRLPITNQYNTHLMKQFL